jgi:chemotaxis methyl-accepting protein methylase
VRVFLFLGILLIAEPLIAAENLLIVDVYVRILPEDLDESAVQIARSGKYPEAIAADASEERLRRFFIRETGGFQIRREVREIVLFATQNLGFGEWRTGPFDIDHLLESTDPRAL